MPPPLSIVSSTSAGAHDVTRLWLCFTHVRRAPSPHRCITAALDAWRNFGHVELLSWSVDTVQQYIAADPRVKAFLDTVGPDHRLKSLTSDRLYMWGQDKFTDVCDHDTELGSILFGMAQRAREYSTFVAS